MKILILTGKFGMGHFSAAKALAQQIENANLPAQVQVVDLVELAFGAASAGIYQVFSTMVRHGGSLYNKIYQGCDTQQGMPNPAKRRFSKALARLIAQQQPQVVISTLPLCTRLAAAHKARHGADYLLVSCITDISCHKEWVAPGVDYYCAASTQTKQALAALGVNPQRVLVTGVPVSPAFAQQPPQRGGKRILVMGGGLGLLPTQLEFYQGLCRIPGAQVTVVTGHNQQLLARLEGLCPNLEALPFAYDIPQRMAQSDVLIAKPGGATLFEALAAGLPLLAFAPDLAQEQCNAQFITQEKIGLVLPRRPLAQMWAIEDFLLSPTALTQASLRMNALAAQISPAPLLALLAQQLPCACA